MAASTNIWSYHATAPGTTFDVAGVTIRHKLDDNDTQDLNTPLLIPSAGTNYGWRKHTRLAILTAPNEQITNLRWFADAAPGDWTGVTLFAGTTTPYVEATTADEAGQLGGTADADTYDEGDPLPVNAGTVAISTDSFPTPGTQLFVLQQMGVASTASPGVITSRTVRYRWDEI
jgi:hypothetical protein